jgi:carbon storage regulator
MLVLTRRIGEEIIIDGDVRITVVNVNREQVRIGITAPPSVRVDRLEIHQRRANHDIPNGRDEKIAEVRLKKHVHFRGLEGHPE